MNPCLKPYLNTIHIYSESGDSSLLRLKTQTLLIHFHRKNQLLFIVSTENCKNCLCHSNEVSYEFLIHRQLLTLFHKPNSMQ